MRLLAVLIWILLLLPQLAIALPLSSSMSADPYDLLRAHYQATGGLERWQQLQSSYTEGTVANDGLRGTFKMWQWEPLQFRLEEDFGVIKQISGDSGNSAWRQDYNGQVELQRDPETLKRRRIAAFLSTFEHLNRHSTIFSLTLEPQIFIDGIQCYVVRLDNTINSDITRYFIAVDSLLLVASEIRQPDITINSRYCDFRQVNGFTLPFQQSDDIIPRQKHHQTHITHIVLQAKINSNLFAVPPPQPPAVTFPSHSSFIDIPFLLVEHRIYLPVTVHNNTGWWLLDSGASSSLIDTDYAQRLHMSNSGQIKGFGYGANFDLSFVTVSSLQVGSVGHAVCMAKHIVMAYKGLSARSYEPTINGILGYDFLSRFVVRVDYASHMLRLFALKDFIPDENLWLDAPLSYHMFTLPVVVDNHYSGRWSVDLGAERSSFNLPYVQQHSRLRRLRERGVEYASQGLGGTNIDYLVRCQTLTIGVWQLDNPVLSLPAQNSQGSAANGELAGNLGASTLENFVVWLDYARQRLRLQRGGDFNKAEKLDKSGMLVGMSLDNRPMISFVAPGSPAQQAGFVAGDVLVSINSHPVAYYAGVAALRELLRQEAGCCYAVSILRAGNLLKLCLCLRDLL